MERALLSLDEALQRLASALGDPSTLPLRADRDDPALDRSAMDGAALRSQDGVSPRKVLGTLYAGDDPARFRILPGTCVRIMTGACLPEGADAVVPREKLLEGQEGLLPRNPPAAGAFVRRRAEQARAGDLLLPAGHARNALRDGLRAQVGQAPPPLERVRVGIASTGDELTREPAPHQIRDSNAPMLAALAHALGAKACPLPPLPDDPSALRTFLEGLGDLEVLLTSGGVSAGEKDHLPQVLLDMGARILFHGIRLKPGKPMLAALLGPRLILALPGNPASSYLNARLFLPVALARLRDALPPDPWREGHLEAFVPNPGERPLLLPCRLEGERLHPLSFRGSADLIRMAQADVCAWIPPGGMGPGRTRYLDLP